MTNQNVPAYPIKDVGFYSNLNKISTSVDGGDFNANFPGVTKLEYFAATAMQGILSKHGLPPTGWTDENIQGQMKGIAVAAIASAKALIEELNKQ